MISINCTQCQQHLEMDDAFAGGVCRCQYCGTIQTVPSHLKKKGTAPQPAGAKTLYQSHPSPGPGTGIPVGKSAPPQAVPYAAPQERRAPNKTLFILAGAGGAALLCVVLGFLLFRKGAPTDTTGP